MVMITDVRRDKKLVHIRLGSRTVTITAALYRLRPLEPGDSVDPEEYENWLMLQQYRPALAYAARLLGQRGHSEGELREKLLRSTCLPRTVDMVILKLKQMKFVDDAAFARDWAAARASHLGRRRIADELRRKGIPGELITQALEALPEEDMADSAARFAASALAHPKPGEDIRVTRQKVMGRLIRRGYSWDEAKDAVDSVLSGAGNDDDD